MRPGDLRTFAAIKLPASEKVFVQPGGRAAGLSLLASFLTERGRDYRRAMSTPVAGWHACSRLSAHLAYGTLSMREVNLAVVQRLAEVQSERFAARNRGVGGSADDGAGTQELTLWKESLRSFSARLRWHCHFMQKLEDEPGIEHANFNSAYDGLREGVIDARTQRQRLLAWAHGVTGYPMVDAVMRCTRQTGWMNFRMRAMAASFASYHLWLHWREPAIELARHFLDFEAGIHYSQFQMQSGTTGINTVRIYSPLKQAQEQDPTGVFIARWVRELAELPAEHRAAPHDMPPLLAAMHGRNAGVVYDPDVHGDDAKSIAATVAAMGQRREYFAPIVDHTLAYAQAKERIFALRAMASTRAEARKVYVRHGSRKKPGTPMRFKGDPEDRGH